MSKYEFNSIEKKWQQYWAEHNTFAAQNESDKPKYYVLDMFPYPSGAGLHVGHPLGYIASDIYARYKRHKGFNVLHPMGYDSFGLPAEQYAIQTGQHPRKTTKENIARYRQQLDTIGFSFDWNREVRTSSPKYYRWTQWIFMQLFESWYDYNADKARSIPELISIFSSEGNTSVNAACDAEVSDFSSEEWNDFSEEKQQKILLQYRLTYLAETEVNWCPALGTVLANDEIVNGVSERGGHPVVRKKMKQWSMRITAYAQRLLDGLDKIDWPQPLKDSQTNWIGRSEGASITFDVKDHDATIEVFTTRPDTIFGVSFMTLAPEHPLVSKITTEAQKEKIEAYVEATAKRSERERMADVKTISGEFTGAYAEHPFTKEPIPIWIGDYVLASYGTGAVMAVPAGDQRDHDFARHFDIPIPDIFEGVDISEEAYAEKDSTPLMNSDFLDGLSYNEAVNKAIEALEQQGAGKGKINYRLRDAVFSRQRYWGEPFPVFYKNGLPQLIDAKHLPLTLPEVSAYLPTEDGQPPLGRADKWAWDSEKNEVVENNKIDDETVFPLELNTMPGWAGSSCYLFRYMDPNNEEQLAGEEALQYWQNVDLYLGGSEHATGHLLYSRFWTKFLHDRGVLQVDEPFKKLINQGMILGDSAFLHRINAGYYQLEDEVSIQDLNDFFENFDAVFDSTLLGRIVSWNLLEGKKVEDAIAGEKYKLTDVFELKKVVDFFEGTGFDARRVYFTTSKIHVPVQYVDAKNSLIMKDFISWYQDELINDIRFENGNSSYDVSREVEKMSKSKYNVVNPDDICEQYGADTLRMYEMFLGPIEQAKPWNTAGITGVHSFLKKLWKLYHGGENGSFQVSDDAADKESLKTLHKTIKKVEEDIENFSFNTSVSTFMIAVNELSAQNCNQREILEPLAILISPYAPHIAEELWEKLGHNGSISKVAFPKFEENHLVESSKEYPISFNGKMRFTMELPLDMSKDDIEAAVMTHEKTEQYLEGRTPKRVIVVPGKIVNIVG